MNERLCDGQSCGAPGGEQWLAACIYPPRNPMIDSRTAIAAGSANSDVSRQGIRFPIKSPPPIWCSAGVPTGNGCSAGVPTGNPNRASPLSPPAIPSGVAPVSSPAFPRGVARVSSPATPPGAAPLPDRQFSSADLTAPHRIHSIRLDGPSPGKPGPRSKWSAIKMEGIAPSMPRSNSSHPD